MIKRGCLVLLHSSGETLILLGIIVLEVDLKLHSLKELSLFLLGALLDLLDGLVEQIPGHLTVVFGWAEEGMGNSKTRKERKKKTWSQT